MCSWGETFTSKLALGDDILMWQRHGVWLNLDTLDLEEAEWDRWLSSRSGDLVMAERGSRVARSSYGQSATTVT
jgi:hypothetical protein